MCCCFNLSRSGELLLAETSDTKSKHNSLTKLQNYLKQRREAGHHTKEPASPQWKPKVHNHKISIQAKGGMKSGPISLSLPDRVPIPLHYPVSSPLLECTPPSPLNVPLLPLERTPPSPLNVPLLPLEFTAVIQWSGWWKKSVWSL